MTLSHKTHRLLDGPVGELLSVTEMPEVVDIAEELILQLRILHHWHGTVLQKQREHVCVCVCVAQKYE